MSAKKVADAPHAELGRLIAWARKTPTPIITREQLAEMAGVSASTIQRLEDGYNVQVKARNAATIVRALGLDRTKVDEALPDGSWGDEVRARLDEVDAFVTQRDYLARLVPGNGRPDEPAVPKPDFLALAADGTQIWVDVKQPQLRVRAKHEKQLRKAFTELGYTLATVDH